jgi:hypothetical protein
MVINRFKKDGNNFRDPLRDGKGGSSDFQPICKLVVIVAPIYIMIHRRVIDFTNRIGTVGSLIVSTKRLRKILLG